MRPGQQVVLARRRRARGTEAKVRLARIGFDDVAGEVADIERVLADRPELAERAATGCPAADVAAWLDDGSDGLQVVDVRNPGETAVGGTLAGRPQPSPPTAARPPRRARPGTGRPSSTAPAATARRSPRRRCARTASTRSPTSSAATAPGSRATTRGSGLVSPSVARPARIARSGSSSACRSAPSAAADRSSPSRCSSTPPVRIRRRPPPPACSSSARPRWSAWARTGGRAGCGSGPGSLFGLTGIGGSLVGSALNRHIDPDVLLLGFAGLVLSRRMADAHRLPDLHRSRRTPELAAAEASGGAPTMASRCAGSTPARRSPCSLAGTVVGFLTGLFGVGGGFVIVPALALGLKLPMPEAIGTSLLVDRHQRRRRAVDPSGHHHHRLGGHAPVHHRGHRRGAHRRARSPTGSTLNAACAGSPPCSSPSPLYTAARAGSSLAS